jgi:FMN phosphatase YigB (HAD superfamily)
MTIQAVVFDIGGILEITPDLGWGPTWGARLGLDDAQLAQFMADLWRDYLGTANTELIEYARRLRPRYRTGILSNSFVGAREREQAAYGFEDLVDELVYSHECGLQARSAHLRPRLRAAGRRAGPGGVPRRQRGERRRSAAGRPARGAVHG